MKNKYRYILVIFVALALYPFLKYVLQAEPPHALYLTLYVLIGNGLLFLWRNHFVPRDIIMKYRSFLVGFVFVIFLFGFLMLDDFVDGNISTSWVYYLVIVPFYLAIGWLFAFLMKSDANERLKKDLIDLKEDEKVIEANNASYLFKDKWLNGSLYLTNYRWIFSSKKKKKEYFAEFKRDDVQLWKWKFLTTGLLFEKKYRINIPFPKWWLKQVNKN